METAKTYSSTTLNPQRTPRTHSDADIPPLPDDSERVAGMSRRGRAFSDPGDPGIITPEDDYLETSDLPQRRLGSAIAHPYRPPRQTLGNGFLRF